MEDNNIFIAAGDGDLTAVKRFLDAGVSVNAQDDFGYSAVHAAASYGQEEVLAFLLGQGGDATMRDSEGDTPLHYCELPTCGDMLLAAGADLLAANNDGDVPYASAVKDARDDMVAWYQTVYAARGYELPTVELEDDEEGDGDEAMLMQMIMNAAAGAAGAPGSSIADDSQED